MDEQSSVGPDRPNPVQPVGSVKAADGAEPFVQLPAGLSAWVGALQLTVLFAATGFIGKVSLQQFLGIDLGNWTASDLSLFAGHWAFDTLAVVLNLLFSQPFRFGWPLLLLIVLVLLSYVLPVRLVDLRRMATMVSLLVVAISLLVVLAAYEVPTLSMSNWLTQTIGQELKEPSVRDGMLTRRIDTLSADLVVSKMYDLPPSVNRDGELVTGADGNICPATEPGQTAALRASWAEMANSQKLHPEKAAVEALDKMYAYTVLICVIAWLAMYFHAAIDAAGAVNEIFRGLRLFVCLLLLPTVSLMIPYTYAKLIYSTSFSWVSVESKPENNGKSEAKPVAGEASARPDGTNSFLVMDETDKDVSLLKVNDKFVPFVQIRGRDEIVKLNRYGTKDVFNKIILMQCNY